MLCVGRSNCRCLSSRIVTITTKYKKLWKALQLQMHVNQIKWLPRQLNDQLQQIKIVNVNQIMWLPRRPCV